MPPTTRGCEMVQRQIVLSVAELQHLEIECPKCGTVMVLDVTKTSYFPEKCPTCPQEFNGFTTHAPDIYRQYISFYNNFSKSVLNPRFRVRETPNTQEST